jgi:bifunctional DNA-binding transcriptional regulator/antitoxin component of YhaV-PrlF toxin-antitoxin module
VTAKPSTAGRGRVLECRRAVALARHYREFEGLSIREIAEGLGRSPATVKAYFYDPTGEKARAVKLRLAPGALRSITSGRDRRAVLQHYCMDATLPPVSEEHRQFVGLQSRGTLALPAELRKRHHLDQAGAQVEIVERDDGVIELHPHVPIRADQAWFWTERWQTKEREVDRHVAAGEVEVFDSADDFLAQLDRE